MTAFDCTSDLELCAKCDYFVLSWCQHDCVADGAADAGAWSVSVFPPTLHLALAPAPVPTPASVDEKAEKEEEEEEGPGAAESEEAARSRERKCHCRTFASTTELVQHRAATGHGCFRCPLCPSPKPWFAHLVDANVHLWREHGGSGRSCKQLGREDRLFDASQISVGRPRRLCTALRKI